MRPKLLAIKRESQGPSKILPLARDVTWQLLSERDASVNISHSRMPTREAHDAFVERHPYRAWYLIAMPGDPPDGIGTVYLTRRNEIGVFVLKQHQGHGYGRWAVKELMRKWGHRLSVVKQNAHLGREFYANINPDNAASIAFFESLGFGVRQLTLAVKVPEHTAVKTEAPAGPPTEGLE